MAGNNKDHIKLGKAEVAMTAVRDLASHTIAMFSLPFIAFYLTLYACNNFFEMSESAALISSVVVAVVTVNLVIASFVRIGYKEALADDKAKAEADKTQAESVKDK